MPIQKLADHIANQIAAGEVVERPASVVKELIENSLDAEATLIEVSIVDGGKELIQITDNGKGIELSDFPLVFERHATSKITNLQDLQQVMTMGFRGEALASIGSVAKVTVLSRHESSNDGWRLVKIDDLTTDPEPISVARGTTIKVEQLFGNVPARGKYLKAGNTEARYILEILQEHAASRHDVQFRFIDNGKTKIDYPQNEDLLTRSLRILGMSDPESLFPIFYQSQDLQIEGFISKPQFAKKTRKNQLISINNRPLNVPFIGHAIKEALHTLIPHNLYPAFVLKIKIDPTAIDVNVHPRKLEARFTYQQFIYQKIKQATESALQKHILTAKLEFAKDKIVQTSPADTYVNSQALSSRQSDFRPPAATFSGSSKRKTMPSFNQILAFNESFSQQKLPTLNNELSIRPLGQIDNSYILGLTKDGLVVIDQHAAHERVRYARLQDLRKKLQSEAERLTQPLLTPIEIDLGIKEKQILNENMEAIQKAGFALEISDNICLLAGIPAALIKDDPISVINGLLADLQTQDETADLSLTDMESRIERVLNYTACRSAIKFGQALTIEEQQALIAELDNIEQNYTCPHGRPTRINISFSDLEKQFGR